MVNDDDDGDWMIALGIMWYSAMVLLLIVLVDFIRI